MRTRTGAGLHYGWVIVGVTFLALLVAAGVRATPAVLIQPLEQDLGWSRAAISAAVSVGLLLYGFGGPAAGWLMDRFGPRWLTLGGLALVGASTLAGSRVDQLWQFTLLWGVLGGLGTGVVAPVLGATVANRWFVARRGFVVGLFGAAASAGQLIAVPVLMRLVVEIGWRAATLVLAGAVLLVLLPVLLLMRDEPASMGLQPYGGDTPGTQLGAAGPDTGGALLRAVRSPAFWLLSGSFFICGATSNGLIGTHLIPHSIEHGIPRVAAADALALMGAMNFLGTLTSGWLTDRYDPRKLLAAYYSFRGLSLLLLPFVDGFSGLAIFAVIFGLDYIATVPPTVALVADRFGRRNVGTVFGWVFFAHQVGAALAAWLGGVVRELTGDYGPAFLSAGVLAMVAGAMALGIRRAPRHVPQPGVAGA